MEFNHAIERVEKEIFCCRRHVITGRGLGESRSRLVPDRRPDITLPVLADTLSPTEACREIDQIWMFRIGTALDMIAQT